jgi:uncharacterized protein with PIN domain
VENVDVGARDSGRIGSSRDGWNTYRSMVMNLEEIEKAYYLLSMHHSETMLENASLMSEPKETNPEQKLCGSCQLNEGVKLVAKGRGGRIKSWRCQGCLNKNKPSWITGK